MRTDFNIQWERYKAWRRRCPFGDEELERRVELAQENGKWKEESGNSSIRPWRLWVPAAAAACLLAVLMPLGLRAHQADSPESVVVEGRQCYFACNKGCSAEGTVEMFRVTFL